MNQEKYTDALVTGSVAMRKRYEWLLLPTFMMKITFSKEEVISAQDTRYEVCV